MNSLEHSREVSIKKRSNQLPWGGGLCVTYLHVSSVLRELVSEKLKSIILLTVRFARKLGK